MKIEPGDILQETAYVWGLFDCTLRRAGSLAISTGDTEAILLRENITMLLPDHGYTPMSFYTPDPDRPGKVTLAIPKLITKQPLVMVAIDKDKVLWLPIDPYE